MSVLNGSGGSIIINTIDEPTVLCVTDWSIEISDDLIDVTTSCSALDSDLINWVDRIAGFASATVTVNTVYDAATLYWEDPLNIVAGLFVTCTLNIGRSGKFFVVPGLFKSVGVKDVVKESIKVMFTIDSSGQVTYP